MARTTFENLGWLPEDSSSEVIGKINATSAVESLARPVPMSTNVVHVPRDGGTDVNVTAKGAAFQEDTSVNDEVELRARKFTGLVRIAEEDIEDAKNIDILNAKKVGWASNYARFIDNATLGTTAAVNGTTVPFQSVYNALATADAELGYTANANILKTAGAVTYDDLNDALALAEAGDYFDVSDAVIIANPSFRASFRGLKDGNGSPLFVQSMVAGTPDSLFGYSVQWSHGARTSAVASQSPTGNPLLIVASRNSLLLGKRSEVESTVIDGRDGTSAVTDETLLKFRVRRGFALAHPNSAAVIEVTSA